MADIQSFEALVAAVTAGAVLAGFLSSRLHQRLDRVMSRSAELSSLLSDRANEGRAVDRSELSDMTRPVLRQLEGDRSAACTTLGLGIITAGVIWIVSGLPASEMTSGRMVMLVYMVVLIVSVVDTGSVLVELHLVRQSDLVKFALVNGLGYSGHGEPLVIRWVERLFLFIEGHRCHTSCDRHGEAIESQLIADRDPERCPCCIDTRKLRGPIDSDTWRCIAVLCRRVTTKYPALVSPPALAAVASGLAGENDEALLREQVRLLTQRVVALDDRSDEMSRSTRFNYSLAILVLLTSSPAWSSSGQTRDSIIRLMQLDSDIQAEERFNVGPPMAAAFGAALAILHSARDEQRRPFQSALEEILEHLRYVERTTEWEAKVTYVRLLDSDSMKLVRLALASVGGDMELVMLNEAITPNPSSSEIWSHLKFGERDKSWSALQQLLDDPDVRFRVSGEFLVGYELAHLALGVLVMRLARELGLVPPPTAAEPLGVLEDIYPKGEGEEWPEDFKRPTSTDPSSGDEDQVNSGVS